MNLKRIVSALRADPAESSARPTAQYVCPDLLAHLSPTPALSPEMLGEMKRHLDPRTHALVEAVFDAELAAKGLLVERTDPVTGARRKWVREKPPKAKGRHGLAARCGALTRRGTFCAALPVPGMSRCRFHGGLSTGPRTLEGRARIAESNRRRAQGRRDAQGDQNVHAPG